MDVGLYCETGATRPREAPRYDVGSYDTPNSARGGESTWCARHSARHGRARLTTRPYQACYTAQCTQVGPRVGALCTRFSFDLMHCSESLFGTLFMSTVHEVFKKIKIKIKINKIIFLK